jgi:hypothetical protein
MEMFRASSNIKELREKFDKDRRARGRMWDDQIVAAEEAKFAVAAPPQVAE